MTDAPEPGAVRPELPGPVLDAVRAASETLAAALRPHMNATNPSPDIDVAVVAGQLERGDIAQATVGAGD